jgi:hypothetical protein
MQDVVPGGIVSNFVAPLTSVTYLDSTSTEGALDAT